MRWLVKSSFVAVRGRLDIVFGRVRFFFYLSVFFRCWVSRHASKAWAWVNTKMAYFGGMNEWKKCLAGYMDNGGTPARNKGLNRIKLLRGAKTYLNPRNWGKPGNIGSWSNLGKSEGIVWGGKATGVDETTFWTMELTRSPLRGGVEWGKFRESVGDEGAASANELSTFTMFPLWSKRSML